MLRKSQKLMKWVSVCLRKCFNVAPVVVLYPWTQTLQDVIVGTSLLCMGVEVKGKNWSQTKNLKTEITNNFKRFKNYKNLKIGKDSFTAGFISKCMESWKEITSNKSILQTVSRGAPIELKELASIPLNTAHKAERLYSDSDKMSFRKEINGLLQKYAIKQVKNLEKVYVSSIFKQEKKKWLILNLKKFNEKVVYQYFKTGNLSSLKHGQMEILYGNYWSSRCILYSTCTMHRPETLVFGPCVVQVLFRKC